MGQASSISYELVQNGRRRLHLRQAGVTEAWETSSADQPARSRVPRLISPLKLSLIVAFFWVLLGLWEYRGQRWGKRNEPYTLAETFYVMAQIVTTVGYGDYCPIHDSGFLFTALYVLTATVVFSSVGTALTDSIIKSRGKIMHAALSELRFSHRPDIALLDEDMLTSLTSISSFVQQLSPGTVAFLKAFAVWLLFVVAGVVFFCIFPGEGKSFAEAFYMSVLTLTTVGFGDKTPSTEEGRVFATIWMLLGTAAFANMVAQFSAAFLSRGQLRRLEQADLKDILHDDLFKKCHPEVSPCISRADFILFMMKDIGVLDAHMVEQLSANFDELDTSHAGHVDTDRLGDFSRIRKHSEQLGQLPRFHTIA